MPANNFEEDVRKKMEELRFVPSAAVWTQVEDKIREDRKRRRFLFWLPLTGLLLGGLIWFAWPDQKSNTGGNVATTQNARGHSRRANNTSVVSGDDAANNGTKSSDSTGSKASTGSTTSTATAASNASAASTAPAASNAPAASTAAGTDNPGKTTTTPSSEKASTASQNDNKTGNNSGENKILFSTESRLKTREAKKKKDDSAPDLNDNLVISKPITNEADYLASQSAASAKKTSDFAAKRKRNGLGSNSLPNGKDKTTVEKNSSDETVKDDLTKPENKQDNAKEPARIDEPVKAITETGADKKITSTIPETTADSIAEAARAISPADSAVTARTNPAMAARKAGKTPGPVKKKNKIEWGFTASGGVSQQLEKNAIPPDVLNRAIASFSVYSLQNSNLKTGPAFSAGFVVAKQIGKTWRLQTGIQYASVSSRLPNANQRLSYGATPSSINPNYLLDASYAYAAGGVYPKNTTYTNRYQFIQIPVMVEKQFGVRSPLSLQAGLAAGYLSSVRALIYQPLVDQYLKDNSQFNKFQLSGIFGIYWKLRIDQHWSLRAGPEVQYQLTDLMKSSVPLNDHLLTGALRITLMRAK